MGKECSTLHSISALVSTHKLYSKVLLRFSNAKSKLIKNRSWVSCFHVQLMFWQIFLKLWCELASGLSRVRWKSMTETPEYGNSILIPATLTLLFYLLFVTYLGYALHIARLKERYFSCDLMHFAVKHTAVSFVKPGRQPSMFLRHEPFRSRNSTNSRNSTSNFCKIDWIKCFN